MDEHERMCYRQLMVTIGWFFFDLFILGYVEDPCSGESFRLPGGLQLCIYVEVLDYVHSLGRIKDLSSHQRRQEGM